MIINSAVHVHTLFIGLSRVRCIIVVFPDVGEVSSSAVAQ